MLIDIIECADSAMFLLMPRRPKSARTIRPCENSAAIESPAPAGKAQDGVPAPRRAARSA